MTHKTDGTHAKNIANFAALIDMLKTFGADYQPTNPAIALPQLESQLKQAEDAQEILNQSRPLYSDAVDKQQLEFGNLSALTTSIANAFKAAGASVKAQETLHTITRKLKGERATARKVKATAEPRENAATGTAATPRTDTISAAQMGYANRIDNFTLLLKTLKTERNYKPKEEHLSLAGLEQKLAALKSRYREVSGLLAPLQEAREHRNNLLYNSTTGLIATTNIIKAYIRSIYKPASAQSKHITALRFTNKH